MPWKLILFLLCLVATTFFVGFNLENTCTINLVFKTYENVPIFLTALIAFAAGVVVAFLFSIGMRISNADKKAKAAKIEKQVKAEVKKETTLATPVNTPVSANGDKPKKASFFEKGKGLLTPKKQESAIDSSGDSSQIIHLDDNQGAK